MLTAARPRSNRPPWEEGCEAQRWLQGGRGWHPHARQLAVSAQLQPKQGGGNIHSRPLGLRARARGKHRIPLGRQSAEQPPRKGREHLLMLKKSRAFIQRNSWGVI